MPVEAPPAASEAGPLPLTRHQTHAWIGQKLHPGRPVHDLVHSFVVPAAVAHADELRAAFADLVRATDALRIVVTADRGLPHQRVRATEECEHDARLDLERAEIRGTSAVAAARAWIARRFAEGIDPARGVFRGAVLRHVEGRAGAETCERSVLVLAMHQVAADGWSFPILVERLLAACAERRAGKKLAPPDHDRTFAAFVREQSAYEASPRCAADRGAFEERLLRDVAPPRFFGRARMQRTLGSRRIALRCGRDRSARLRALAARLLPAVPPNVALFDVLLAAFAAFVHRTTGARSLRIGAPVLNRETRFRATPGLFMNVLPLLLETRPRDAFDALVERTAGESARAVEGKRAAIGNHRGGAYDLVFNMHAQGRPRLARGGALVERWHHPGLDEAALALHVRGVRARGLAFLFDLHDDVTPAGEHERFPRRFLALLDAVLADPSRTLDSIDLCGGAERREIARCLDAAERAAREPVPTVHRLFEEQAARTPDAVALRGADDSSRDVRYAELDAAAEEVAATLRAAGVAREAVVGVCLERSEALLASVLGILKAGCAWLPLDPSHPAARLHATVDEAGASVVITTESLAGACVPAGARRIEPPVVARGANARRHSSAGEGDDCDAAARAAYVLMTSGSTGRPKGVVGLHRGIVNRCRWMWRAFPFAQDEVACWKTTVAFVDSVWEMFGALLHGVPTEIVPADVAADPAALLGRIERARVTRITVVPSLLERLLDRPDAAATLARLRVCVSSGEALRGDLARRFREIVPGARLLNLYGSSEVAGDVTWRDAADDGDGVAFIAAGAPVDGTALVILENAADGFRLVAPGCAGEVFVAGAHLARGYHRRPERSAEAFVELPLGPGGTRVRLYRTGDLGRVRADGALEWLGRRDRQLKVRGQRVEPGEIEAAVLAHPGVKGAVVAAFPENTAGATGDDASGGARLACFVVPRARAVRLDPREVRGFLRARLPEAFVPSHVVQLVALPLSRNGKVDPAALPWNEVARGGGAGEGAAADPASAPRDPVERFLVRTWEKLLRARGLGTHDDFFLAGGDSLAAIDVAARIERRFGVQVPLARVAAPHTIAELAEWCRAAGASRDAANDGAVAAAAYVADAARATPLFCVPAAGAPAVSLLRLREHLEGGAERAAAGALAIDLIALEPRGLAPGERPPATVEEMAEHHLAHVRARQPHGPYRLAGRCFGGIVAFEMARRLLASGEVVEALIVLDTVQPPGLARRAQRMRGGSRGASPRRARKRLRRRLERRVRKRLRRLLARVRAPFDAATRRRAALVAAQTAARRTDAGGLYPGRIVLLRTGRGGLTYAQARWAEFAAEGLETRDVPGTHRTMLREPEVRIVAEVVRACLNEARTTPAAAVTASGS